MSGNFVGKYSKGDVFGRLTLIKASVIRVSGAKTWECICSCGEKKIVALKSLVAGRTKSCGCLKRDTTGALKKKHGATGTPEYAIWKSMKQRCCNPNNKAFPNYGGRGIDISPEWLESFAAFISDMGHRPHVDSTLERMDNYKGYSKENCIWASRAAQLENRRNTILVIREGKSFSPKGLATFLGRTTDSIRSELRRKYRRLGNTFIPVEVL